MFQNYSYMWTEGWFDDYSDEHFLMKLVSGKMQSFYGENQLDSNNCPTSPPIPKGYHPFVLLQNLATKLYSMEHIFGKENVKRFVKNQLSAGKSNYDEAQFFRALSEISVIVFLVGSLQYDKCIYEYRTNGKKNPEVRFILKNGAIIDVEVKTPGFNTSSSSEPSLLPLCAISTDGQELIHKICNENGITYISPRINKLKDFINSATDKFEYSDSEKHINLLFINWTYSEFSPLAYLEPFYLLANPINGIISSQQVGITLGINEDAFRKISAIFMYTDSLEGLAYFNLRHLWINNSYKLIPVDQTVDFIKCIGIKPSHISSENNNYVMGKGMIAESTLLELNQLTKGHLLLI